MRSFDSDLITEKNKETSKPIFLYTIHDYDGLGENLCFNSWDEPLTYDGVVYLPEVCVHDDISQNQDSEVDAISLMIGNVDRQIQSYLESFDFRRKKVTIKRVFLDTIADITAFSQDVFYIEDYSVTEQEVNFTLVSVFSLLGVKCPGRLMSRNFCGWKFKGSECAYAGAETECNKTLARCRVLSNQLRYGGFPGIPARKVLNA